MIEKIKALCVKYKEVLLYLIFGGLTTLVSLASYWLCVYPLGIDVLISNVISWICAVTFAYVTNAKWVFEARPANRGEQLRQMVSFYVGRLATLGVEELILLVFVTLLHGNEMIVKVIAQIVVVILNYVVSKLLVFRKDKENPAPEEDGGEAAPEPPAEDAKAEK